MNLALGVGAEQWLKGQGGLRARILTDGVLQLPSHSSSLVSDPTHSLKYRAMSIPVYAG
jgi:hypothetical protein